MREQEEGKDSFFLNMKYFLHITLFNLQNNLKKYKEFSPIL